MSWQETTVLAIVTAGATLVAAVAGFDPLPVYVGVLGWGGRAVAGR
jgi:hypothetical protein